MTILKNKIILITTTIMLVTSLLAGCTQDAGAMDTTNSTEISEENTSVETVSATENDIATASTIENLSSTWSEETHSNDVDPNYDVVFNQEEVMELYITIDSENWETMYDDLSENLSNINVAGGRGNKQQNTTTDTETTDYEPIWVTSTVSYDGDTWENVGIRFKGNSSLSSAFSSGNEKLSLKLDFDEFEDEYPEIEDQRFYGFKQLNLNNNFSDESFLREKVSADVFREYGLVASETSFCAVYVDYGEGMEYFGLYTMVEEMDDTTIDTQLGDDSGNLYKPDGDAASFAEGTYDADEMEKKSNEDEADYSDVEALYEIINSDLRTTDLTAWMTELESVFNVDGFLKWLAVNTVIQNWDTYGNMTHNYYLYNDPDTGLLNWIPWDNNEAFSQGKSSGALDLELTKVGGNWPLISYITEIDEYRAIYDAYMEGFVTDVFNEENMTALYEEYAELIQPYAYAEEEGSTFLRSDSAFDAAIKTLIDHVVDRNEAVEAYLE